MIVTCAPSAANRLAAPRPIPLPPPVTSAASPSKPGTTKSLQVYDRDGLLRAHPRRLVTLGAQRVVGFLLQHVQEVVLAHFEDLGRNAHAQRVALAAVEIDHDPEPHL